MLRSLLNSEPTELDDAIARLHEHIARAGPVTEEYTQLLTHLERLQTLKNTKRSWRPDPNTLALVLGNIAGILIIVHYERAAVMTSKAVGFIMKTN